MRKYLNLRANIALGLIFAFLLNSFGPLPAYAQDFVLPVPGARVNLSLEFNPPILKGIKVHPDNPFRFDFILDRGEGQLSNDALKDESSKLIKYFLASLTIPEKDLWVNLSPYEKDRIVPESFGRTEMGRDLLAEDYILKQITASLIYPEGETGKRFWKRIYAEASKKFGTTNIPVNTFNKVWIVPEKAVVYENAKAGTAYVVESKLKVMLEQDYLALSHSVIPAKAGIQNTNALGSQIIREIVIPELTKEVSEGKNFSQLRQVYNSLILATWYKKKIKDSILKQVYANKNKVAGVNIDDPREKQRIYERYLQAFKKGAYNYIKEELDPATQQVMPRKYFSGGIDATDFAQLTLRITDTIDQAQLGNSGRLLNISASLKTEDQAMATDITRRGVLQLIGAWAASESKLIRAASQLSVPGEAGENSAPFIPKKISSLDRLLQHHFYKKYSKSNDQVGEIIHFSDLPVHLEYDFPASLATLWEYAQEYPWLFNLRFSTENIEAMVDFFHSVNVNDQSKILIDSNFKIFSENSDIVSLIDEEILKEGLKGTAREADERISKAVVFFRKWNYAATQLKNTLEETEWVKKNPKLSRYASSTKEFLNYDLKGLKNDAQFQDYLKRFWYPLREIQMQQRVYPLDKYPEKDEGFSRAIFKLRHQWALENLPLERHDEVNRLYRKLMDNNELLWRADQWRRTMKARSIGREQLGKQKSIGQKRAVGKAAAVPRRMIIIGGTFDDKGGVPSTIIAQMHAAMPEGTKLVNGGYFSQIPQLIKDIASYDTVLWFPNIPNDKEKIRNIKQRYPPKYVVTSKRNHNNQYTTADIVDHGLKLGSDLVVEFSDTVPFRMRLIDPQGNVFEDTKAPETLARTIVKQLDILKEGPRPKTEAPVNERTSINGIIIGGVFDEKGGRPSALIKGLQAAFPEGVDVRNGGSMDDLKRIMDDLGKYEVVMWFAQMAQGQDPWLALIKKRYPFKTLIAPMFNPDGKTSFQEMVNRALGLRSNLFVEFKGRGPTKMKLYDPLSNQFTDTADPLELGRAIMGRLEALGKFTRQGTMSIGKALSMPDSNELSAYLSIVRDYGERFHDFIHPAEGVERFLGNTAFRGSYMFPGRPEFQDIMFISRRNVDKRDLTKEGFVAIKMGSYANPRIAYYGERKPSVDTPTQMRFLDELPNVNFILHAHVYIKGAPFTHELIPCGSVDEVKEVLATIGHDRSKTNFAVNLLGHGSIIFAHDLDYLAREIFYTARLMPEPLGIDGKPLDLIQRLKNTLERNPGKEPQADGTKKEASVILLLRKIDGKWHVLLTKRAQGMSYAGLWSLPGGTKSISDASLQEAGLREFEEEMGVSLEDADFIGQLAAQDTQDGKHRIFPFVAVTNQLSDFRPNPDEVEDHAWVPLDALSAQDITIQRNSERLVLNVGLATRKILEKFSGLLPKDRAMISPLELQSVKGTVGRLFIDAVKASGNVPALKAYDGEVSRDISWQELYQGVIRTAKGLMALGIRRGDRVVVLSEDNLEFVYLDLAALLIGAVTVPPFPTNSAEQVRYIVDDTTAKAIFVENDEQLKKVMSVKSQMPSLEHVFVMDRLKALWAKGDDVDDADLRERVSQVLPTDISSITYTSGTTGTSKGVVHIHSSFSLHAGGMSEKMEFGPQDTYLCYFPLSHAGGRISLYAALSNHTIFAIPRGRDIDSVMVDLRQIRPTVMLAIPSLVLRMYTEIRSLMARSGIDPSDKPRVDALTAGFFGGRLRYIQEGGAPMDEGIIRFFDQHGVKVLEAYGLAETGSTTFNTLTERKAGTVGKPIGAIKIKIDPATKEVLIKGDTVMQGYWNKPDETKAVLRDGWFHTGDMGHIDDEGFLTITGRIKNLIMTLGGSNIPREPIEEALLRYKYFQQVHLVGEQRKYMTALVVPNMEELKAFARGQGLDEQQDLLGYPQIRELLWEGVAGVNRNLDQFEQIHKIGVLRSAFTVESGQLGVLGKQSSKNIEDAHRRVIDELYQAARDVQVIVETPGDLAMTGEDKAMKATSLIIRPHAHGHPEVGIEFDKLRTPSQFKEFFSSEAFKKDFQIVLPVQKKDVEVIKELARINPNKILTLAIEDSIESAADRVLRFYENNFFKQVEFFYKDIAAQNGLNYRDLLLWRYGPANYLKFWDDDRINEKIDVIGVEDRQLNSEAISMVLEATKIKRQIDIMIDKLPKEGRDSYTNILQQILGKNHQSVLTNQEAETLVSRVVRNNELRDKILEYVVILNKEEENFNKRNIAIIKNLKRLLEDGRVVFLLIGYSHLKPIYQELYSQGITDFGISVDQAMAEGEVTDKAMNAGNRAMMVEDTANYNEAQQMRLKRLAGERMEKGFWNDEKMAAHSVWVTLDTIQGFREARRANNVKIMAELYRQYVIGYKSKKKGAQSGQGAFFYEVGGLRGLISGQKKDYLSKRGSPASLLRFALPELIDLKNPDALDPLEVEHNYWTDPDNARYHFYQAVDTIFGFKVAREKNDIKKMAELYRQYVIGYKSKQEGAENGQLAFFSEVGGLRGLFGRKLDFLAKTYYSPAALLRFALPELIDLKNPDALDPLEVQHNYWTDPDNARYHIYQAVDTIPGFKVAREKNDIKKMAELYRQYVIGYKSKKEGAQSGQGAFFYEVGGLKGLMTYKRDYLAKRGSPASLLRFALPGLIDLKNPDALDPLEVEHNYWTDPDNARYHFYQTVDTILGFKVAREKNDIKKMAELYRQYVIGYKSKQEGSANGQLAFFLEVGGLTGLLGYKYDYLANKRHSPPALLRFALPGLIDDGNKDALKSAEVERVFTGSGLIGNEEDRAMAGGDEAMKAAETFPFSHSYNRAVRFFELMMKRPGKASKHIPGLLRMSRDRSRLLMIFSNIDYKGESWEHGFLFDRAFDKGYIATGTKNEWKREWISTVLGWDEKGNLNWLNLTPPMLNRPGPQSSDKMLAFLGTTREQIAHDEKDEEYRKDIHDELIHIARLIREAALKKGIDPSLVKTFTDEKYITELGTDYRTDLKTMADLPTYEELQGQAMVKEATPHKPEVSHLEEQPGFTWSGKVEVSFGIHVRVAMRIAKLAESLPDLKITFKANDNIADAKSMHELIFLGANQGTEISIEVQGATKERAEEVIGKFREIIGPDKAMHGGDTAMAGGDAAMKAKNTGGIDLTSDKALTVQNNGQGIKFHLDPAQLQQLQNAPGFVPVIISIQPLKNLPEFLGLTQPQISTQLASSM